MDATRIIDAARKIHAAYRRDAAARYALMEEWTLPPVDCRRVGVDPFEYAGELVSVAPEVEHADLFRVVITIHPFSADSGVCDGCSLSPDLTGCVEASLFHDPWYIEMDRMSATTGIPVADLRRLGDAVFGALCVAYGAPGPIARVYYNAVRLLGGLYHRARKHVGIILVALVLAILAGCSVPDILDGDPPTPVYERAAP